MKPIFCLCFYLTLISYFNRVDLTPIIKPVENMASGTKPALPKATATVETSANAKNTTSGKAFEYYDDYDDKFYKDYYNEDYEEEKKALVKQETKPETTTTSRTTTTTTKEAPLFLTNKSKFNLKVLTTTRNLPVNLINSNKEYAIATSKSVVELTASTATGKKTTTMDEYDFSDYYDDYYDEDYLNKVESKKVGAKLGTTKPTTTKPTTTKPTSTKPSKVIKKISTTTGGYDYYDYLDSELDQPKERTTTITTSKAASGPSLKLNKVISYSTSTKSTAITNNTNLLDKPVTKKVDEYDEYYEDDEYKEDDLNYDDYYDDNYTYDEKLNSSSSTSTTSTTARPELKAPNVAGTGTSTTKKTSITDEYDEDNYEYYDDSSKEYQYSDEYYDDELNKLAAEKSTTAKAKNVTITKLPTVTRQNTTKTSSTSAQPTIVIVPEVIETVKQQPDKVQVITTTPTTTTKAASTPKPFETEIYFNDLDDYNMPQDEQEKKKPENHSVIDITLLKGDLRLKELIKSPALLAGIFGGLLLGLVTALLLLIYIIYRVRNRRYQAAMKYDLDTDIKNVKYYDAKERKRNKKLKAGSKKRRKGSDEKTKIIIDDASSNDQNLLSSSQLSTPSNNATGSTNSNTGLISTERATLMNNSRLLKYTSTGNNNTLRIVSSTLSSNESSNSPNNENSFDYAYIKAPTKEFYA